MSQDKTMRKRLSVETLIDTLSQLENKYVEVNLMGNLAITDDESNYVGYIDFLDGSLEMVEDGE